MLTYLCEQTCVMSCMWTPEDKFDESAIFIHQEGSTDGTLAVRCGAMSLYSLSHPDSLLCLFIVPPVVVLIFLLHQER